MSLLAGTRLGPYEIVALLGVGGMGEVYLARDEYLGREVAIKVLPQRSESDRRATERFFREARAASALNHPHIVTIYGAGQVEAGCYIVMELVRGRTMRALIGQPLTIDALRDLGTQIAKALAAAHEAGIVHRDIKPDNIMVRDDGYVKVLDFGLARLKLPVPAESVGQTIVDTAAHAIVGTARYMSPEQASGGTVDEATDVFSLGIILYELATGRHPFEGDSPYAVLHTILVEPPLPPLRLNAELPREIGALILRMLEKDPRQRPRATEVVSALAASSPQVYLSLAAATAAASRRTVGREHERAALRAAFEQAAAGHGLLMCVTGEPGIGKTTLVEDFLAELDAAAVECRVARGRCSERLAGTEAYLPLLDALEHLLRTTDGPAMARLMKTVAPLWYAQVGATASDESSAVRAMTVRAGTQERWKRELVAFLEEAARLRPLVLFFDDLHWVDVSTVDLISYLASQFDAMAILVIVTYRPEELLRNKHPFLRVKQDLQARGCCRELMLDFLTAKDVEAYLRLEFPEHRFPPTFADLIHAKTEGNPLFMVDVLRYLRDREVLAKGDDGWTLNQTLPNIARSLPESVRSMIQRKIDVLEEADRRLLLTASVQGYEFDGAVVARVLKMDPADLEERLERLDRIHAFVRPLRELEFPDQTLTLRYRFVHVLYQNLLYAALTPARKVAISKAVADALETSYGARVAEIASEVAVLREAAREFSRAADHFLTAAKHAARVFAYQEAVLLAQRGLELLEGLAKSPERSRCELALLLTMGVPLTAAKGFGHPLVEEVYSRARALCLELNETSELFLALWGLFNFSLVALRLDDAREAANRLIDLAQKAENPGLIIQASHALGLVSFHRGDFPIALEHVQRVATLYDRQAHRANATIFGFDPCAAAGAYGACILWMLGYPDRALGEIEAKLRLARELGHAYTLAYALFFTTLLHQFRREWEPASRYSEELLAVSSDKDLPHFKAAARIFLGLALAEHGHCEEGVQRMREGLAAYQATGAQTSRPRVRTQLAEHLGRAGRVEEGLNILAEEIESAGSARYYLAELYRVQGELLLRQGDRMAVERAESCFHRAIDVARSQQAKSLELRAVISLSRCWLRQGKTDDGRKLLAATCSWFTEGFDTGDLQEAKSLLDAMPE